MSLIHHVLTFFNLGINFLAGSKTVWIHVYQISSMVKPSFCSDVSLVKPRWTQISRDFPRPSSCKAPWRWPWPTRRLSPTRRWTDFWGIHGKNQWLAIDTSVTWIGENRERYGVFLIKPTHIHSFWLLLVKSVNCATFVALKILFLPVLR